MVLAKLLFQINAGLEIRGNKKEENPPNVNRVWSQPQDRMVTNKPYAATLPLWYFVGFYIEVPLIWHTTHYSTSCFSFAADSSHRSFGFCLNPKLLWTTEWVVDIFYFTKSYLRFIMFPLHSNLIRWFHSHGKWNYGLQMLILICKVESFVSRISDMQQMYTDQPQQCDH